MVPTMQKGDVLLMPLEMVMGSVKYKDSNGQYHEINGIGNGGLSDYSSLTNKPTINNVTLTGNKTLGDLGIVEMGAATNLANGSAGLVPAPQAGDEEKYLRGDKTWATPPSAPTYEVSAPLSMTTTNNGRTISIGVMGAASNSSNGTAGIVPAPQAGDEGKFLRGDGSWQTVSSGGGGGSGTTDYTVLTNKPQINGITLTGNVALNTLGIAPADSPTITGTPIAPDIGSEETFSRIATKNYVDGHIPNLSGYAPLNSPAFTGTPTAPDSSGNTSSRIVTTNDLTAAISNIQPGGGGSASAGDISIKKITHVFPANTTQDTYGPDAWVDSSVSCYAHDMAVNNINTSVSWTFSDDGTITFEVGSEQSEAFTFNFYMIKANTSGS